MGCSRHRLVDVDSHSSLSGREETLVSAHRDRFRRVIRSVSDVYDSRMASATGPTYLSSIPRPYYLYESSLYVLLRCLRQDVTIAAVVLLYVPLSQMRS